MLQKRKLLVLPSWRITPKRDSRLRPNSCFSFFQHLCSDNDAFFIFIIVRKSIWLFWVSKSPIHLPLGHLFRTVEHLKKSWLGASTLHEFALGMHFFFWLNFAELSKTLCLCSRTPYQVAPKGLRNHPRLSRSCCGCCQDAFLSCFICMFVCLLCEAHLDIFWFHWPFALIY